MIYLSLLTALAGVFGVLAYSRRLPKSISAMVYDYRRPYQWAWSVWLVAVGALLLPCMLERLPDGLEFLGFWTVEFLCGAAVTPLVNRETTRWHNLFGAAAGLASQGVVAVLCPWWLCAWAVYVACLPFKAVRPYLVLVSETVCAASTYGCMITNFNI